MPLFYRLLRLICAGLTVANVWRGVGTLRQLDVLAAYAVRPNPTATAIIAFVWAAIFLLLGWRVRHDRNAQIGLIVALVAYASYFVWLPQRDTPLLYWHIVLILIALLSLAQRHRPKTPTTTQI